jgi:pilus assembly protein CpaE
MAPNLSTAAQQTAPSTAPKALLIGASPDAEAIVRRQLGDLVEISASVGEPKLGLTLFRQHLPAVAVLYLDNDRDAILKLSQEISRASSCATVIVSNDRDPDTILQAMRSGARDFAYLGGADDDVRRALLTLNLNLSQGQIKDGKVTAVFSCKGGSGATTIATNLAGALLNGHSEASGQVVLLDLDFQMGDTLVFLDLASRYSWTDLRNNLHRLDKDLLFQSLTTHDCGLSVVAQADQPEEADELGARDVSEGIRFLRRHFQHVVLDGLRDFRDTTLAALDAADTVFLTMTQDIPALKNANRCLQVFRKLGYSGDKVKLVLNRFNKRGDLDPDSIADALGAPVHVTVANDFPTVSGAVNVGSLLVKAAPRARVTADVKALIPLLDGAAAAEPKKRLLARWSKR